MLMKSFFHGRLVRDIELKHTDNNIAYCRFQLAADRYVGGNKGTVTEYPSFVAWRNVAERLATHTQKGTELVIEAQYTSYKKQVEGLQYPITIVEFSVDKFEYCGSKRDSATNTAPSESTANAVPAKNTKNASPAAASSLAEPSFEDFEEIEGEEGDLPF